LLLSIFIKIKNNGVLIYDAHELESLSAGHSRLKSKCVFLYEKLLWRYIDGLIVVSQSIGLWYMNNIGNKPYEIILNSPLITINNNKTNTSYLREHFCIPPHHKIFIYVGLLRIGRSLDLIIKAFSQLEESASVVFLGYGPLKDELKNNSCMFSNIYFHPPVPHYEVVSLTKSADFGLCLIENVSLSDYYSLPNKIFEYAFASKPILASNFPEISLFIQKHRMGQVCELNLRSILASIRYLIYDYKFNSTLPDLSHYSWETQKKNLIKFYTKICK
jgi:glycosyltransferase involved in cell wall biosynthesis